MGQRGKLGCTGALNCPPGCASSHNRRGARLELEPKWLRTRKQGGGGGQKEEKGDDDEEEQEVEGRGGEATITK